MLPTSSQSWTSADERTRPGFFLTPAVNAATVMDGAGEAGRWRCGSSAFGTSSASPCAEGRASSSYVKSWGGRLLIIRLSQVNMRILDQCREFWLRLNQG